MKKEEFIFKKWFHFDQHDKKKSKKKTFYFLSATPLRSRLSKSATS